MRMHSNNNICLQSCSGDLPNVAVNRTSNQTDVLAYRVDDFCRLIGIGRTHFYRLIDRGEINTIMLGGRRLVAADEARRLLSGTPNSSTSALSDSTNP